MKSVLIKTIPGYEFYSDGRIWSEKKKQFLTGHTNEKGYNKVVVDGQVKGRHQWIAIMFMRVPEEYKDTPYDEFDVHHKDGNKLNNRIGNLEYVPHSKHLRDHHPKAKIFQYGLDGMFIREWDTMEEVAEHLGCSVSAINLTCLGYNKTAKNYQLSYEKHDRIPPIKSRYERALEAKKNRHQVNDVGSI